MKCRLRFKVEGTLRPDRLLPIRGEYYVWEFEATNGLISHVTATARIAKSDWPTVTPDPRPGIKASIRVDAPHLPFVHMELRTIQGLLSLFGLRAIDIRNPEFEWIPESEDERRALPLRSYKRSLGDVDPRTVPAISFDLLTRAVLAAYDARKLEIPLSFFRRGRCDVEDEQYIEAIYDFYFVLETMFANGKSRTAAVIGEFQSSKVLREAVEEAFRDPPPVPPRRTHVARLIESLRTKSVDEYLEHIVKMRGSLHHHSLQRRGSWHPERQEEYEAEALVLQIVSFSALYAAALPHLQAPEVQRGEAGETRD